MKIKKKKNKRKNKEDVVIFFHSGLALLALPIILKRDDLNFLTIIALGVLAYGIVRKLQLLLFSLQKINRSPSYLVTTTGGIFPFLILFYFVSEVSPFSVHKKMAINNKEPSVQTVSQQENFKLKILEEPREVEYNRNPTEVDLKESPRAQNNNIKTTQDLTNIEQLPKIQKNNHDVKKLSNNIKGLGGGASLPLADEKQRFFMKVDLSTKLKGLLEKYQNGFKGCEENKDNNIYCSWSEGTAPFVSLSIEDNELFINFSTVDKALVSQLVTFFSKQQMENLTIQPVEMGGDIVNKDLLEHQYLKIIGGYDDLAVGDKLFFGCTLIIPHYKGRLEFLATPMEREVYLKKCTPEVFNLLGTSFVQYKTPHEI